MTRRHLRRRHIEEQLATLLDLMHTQNRVLRELSRMVAEGRDPRERSERDLATSQWSVEKGWHEPPPPIDPDPDLVADVEGYPFGGRKAMRRHAQEMHDEAVRLTEKDDDDWPPNDANEMVYKRRAKS